MDYLQCEVSKEHKWLEDPLLIVMVHFSPEMIAIIDNDFMYEEPLLTINHGTWLVRHWLKQPGVQLRPLVRRFAYTQGTTAQKVKEWEADFGQSREQLEIFRWRLIKKQRGIPEKTALPVVHHPQQEILEPLQPYNGNYGAKGY